MSPTIPEWTYDNALEAIAVIISDFLAEDACNDDQCDELAKLIADRLEKGPP